MVGKKDPRAEEKPLSRARRIEAECQTSELRLGQVSPLGQQLHDKKEGAVGKERTAEPGHEG